MMWQVAWIIMTMVAGLQVHASNGAVVQNLFSTTNDAKTSQVDKFIGPDSKVDPKLRQAVQSLRGLVNAPTCNQMAGSALIHTCDTFTDEDGKRAGKALEEEMKLFAARYAICELSESKDWSNIPPECESFVPTEDTANQQHGSGYTIVDGRQQPVPRSRDYYQATRQDCEPCVAALSKSPQAWTSYSNSKQNAHVWCSVVRSDIEKDELIRNLREGIEVAGLAFDALREAEAQQKVVIELLNAGLRKFVQDFESSASGFAEVWNDVRATARVETHSIVDELVNNIRNTISKEVDAIVRNSTELVTAQSSNVEQLSERSAYIVEAITQHVMQFASNVTNTLQQGGVQVLGTLYKADNSALALEQRVVSTDSKVENMSIKAERADAFMETLESRLETLGSRLLRICDVMDWLFGCLPVPDPYFRYVATAGIILLFLRHVLGGSALLQVIRTICKYTAVIAGVVLKFSAKLAKRVGNATVSHLSDSGNLLKQSMGAKSAIFILLAVMGITRYLVVVEGPKELIQRWERRDATQVEITIFVMVICFVVVVLSAPLIMRLMFAEADDEEQAPANPSRATRGLPFNNPKNYGNKECPV